MVRISVLGDALKTMYNAEKRGKVSRSRWPMGVKDQLLHRAAIAGWSSWATANGCT
jgi:hypothetical protein